MANLYNQNIIQYNNIEKECKKIHYKIINSMGKRRKSSWWYYCYCYFFFDNYYIIIEIIVFYSLLFSVFIVFISFLSFYLLKIIYPFLFLIEFEVLIF